MSDALENLELASLHFAPEILMLGGILVIAAGLTTWLGGLKFTPWMSAIVAALTGLTVALLFVTPSTITICAFTIIPATIACFLKRPIIIFTGAALAAAAGAIFSIVPALNETSLSPPKHPFPYEDGDRMLLSATETAKEIQKEAIFWTDAIVNAAKDAPATGFAVGIIAALLLLAGGFILPRLIAAVTCATLGISMIYIGMVMVLLFKGARPLTHINARLGFYGTVAVGMILFGTLTQLVLCPSKPKYSDTKNNKRGEM